MCVCVYTFFLRWIICSTCHRAEVDWGSCWLGPGPGLWAASRVMWSVARPSASQRPAPGLHTAGAQCGLREGSSPRSSPGRGGPTECSGTEHHERAAGVYKWVLTGLQWKSNFQSHTTCPLLPYVNIYIYSLVYYARSCCFKMKLNLRISDETKMDGRPATAGPDKPCRACNKQRRQPHPWRQSGADSPPSLFFLLKSASEFLSRWHPYVVKNFPPSAQSASQQELTPLFSSRKRGFLLGFPVYEFYTQPTEVSPWRTRSILLRPSSALCPTY